MQSMRCEYMQFNVRVAPFMPWYLLKVLFSLIVVDVVEYKLLSLCLYSTSRLTLIRISKAFGRLTTAATEHRRFRKKTRSTNTFIGIEMAVAFHAVHCAYCIMSPHKPCIVWCNIIRYHSRCLFTSHSVSLSLSRCLIPIFLVRFPYGAFIAAVMCYFYCRGTLISKPIIEIKQI